MDIEYKEVFPVHGFDVPLEIGYRNETMNIIIHCAKQQAISELENDNL